MPDPTLFDRAIDNRSLFSDHFLEQRLPAREEWQADVPDLFEKVKALYERERAGLQAANEAQTEKDFIKPVLALLGWHYDVQVAAKKQGKRNVPDYALFTSEADAQAAKPLRTSNEDAYFARTAAVADAKYWGRPLDAPGNAARDPLSNKNPSFQIVNYMTAFHLDWGLLTNGARWRLYYAEARSRVDTYYEANLEHILREDDEDGFRRFVLFFRAAAFRPASASGRTFLQSVYDGSVRYGEALEDRLKDLVFDDIFLHLAEGFAESMEQEKPAQADLDEVYHSTLRLLYRLLFLLHAEARALLPVADRQGYYHYSLTRIKEDVAKAVRAGRTLSGVSTDKWNDLESLFRIIDEGEAGLNVPHYNGGLFDRANPENAFLNEHAVADKHLVPAIDKLARDADGHFIDYKALDVEQLGSIYEGLLEFRLRMDDGALVLENDKGERKATGSYYTPHYIVAYITEHTLGPVLEEREAQFRRLMEEQIVPKYEKLKALDAAGPSAKGLQKQLAPLEEQAVEALLSIKVCDPAMGSGHFLTHAVRWLTDRLVTILSAYPENPVQRRLDAIRARILGALDAQGITVDAEQLTPMNLLKRMVMKRCIYGVDLNPMAVELARLSLWLDSFTVGAPLSFLNHHLKVGNALIGTDAREMVHFLEADAMTSKGQVGQLFAGGKLKQFLSGTAFMRKVAFNTDATFDEVKESAQQYDAYQQAMRPYEKWLDLWTSRHFGNERAEDLVRSYGDQVFDVVMEGGASLNKKQQQTVARAAALAAEKRFFHWELAFPEVFFDLKRSDWKEHPGFDAVIGNPPWLGVRTGTIGSKIVEWLRRRYASAVGQFDLAAVFLEIGSRMAGQDKTLGFVVPKRIATNESYEALRKRLIVDRPLKAAIDLGVAFEGVNNDALILISGVKNKTDVIEVGERIGKDKIHSWSIERVALESMPFQIIPVNSSSSDVSLVRKVVNQPILRFGEIAEINRGAECGMNHPAITKSAAPDSLPLVDHLGVGPYAVVHADWHIDPSRIKNSVLKSLSLYRVVPKLLIRFLSSELVVGKDTVGYTSTNLVYHVHSDSNIDFLCAVLSSRLLSFWYRTAFQNDEVKFPHVQKSHLQQLPIRRIAFETPPEEREALAAEAIAAYEEAVEHKELLPWTGEVSRSDGGVDAEGANPWSTTPSLRDTPPVQEGSFASVLKLVEGHLAAAPERADVVHDLLAHLAERMTDLHAERQRLEAALDPFKFLDRGVRFQPFPEAFAEEIKYGARCTDPVELSAVHHDLDGLRLAPSGDAWTLEVQLKKRDPESGWKDWQKDGPEIARQWAPAYRFDLSEEKARYYQQAFAVLDQFAEASRFPGGYTRSTQKKLHVAAVPAFDPAADLTPLVELLEERAAVQQALGRTDALIDQIVYRLYGLTDDEVALVEGTAANPPLAAS